MCWTHYKLPTYLTLWPTDVQDVAYLWSAACAVQIPAIKLSDKTGDERLRARVPWLTRCPRGNNRQAVAGATQGRARRAAVPSSSPRLHFVAYQFRGRLGS